MCNILPLAVHGKINISNNFLTEHDNADNVLSLFQSPPDSKNDQRDLCSIIHPLMFPVKMEPNVFVVLVFHISLSEVCLAHVWFGFCVSLLALFYLSPPSLNTVISNQPTCQSSSNQPSATKAKHKLHALFIHLGLQLCLPASLSKFNFNWSKISL